MLLLENQCNYHLLISVRIASFVGRYTATTWRYVGFLSGSILFGCLKNSVYVSSIELLARPYANLVNLLLFAAAQTSA